MKILRHNKFHPNKVKLVQELSDNDFDRRLKSLHAYGVSVFPDLGQ